MRGELLTGFIGLYGIGGDMEVCGMVRPGYRRRGDLQWPLEAGRDHHPAG
ncbi:hypothetical protein ACFSQ7_19235 [Paenibacillus rhizoplanae]